MVECSQRYHSTNPNTEETRPGIMSTPCDGKYSIASAVGGMMGEMNLGKAQVMATEHTLTFNSCARRLPIWSDVAHSCHPPFTIHTAYQQRGPL